MGYTIALRDTNCRGGVGSTGHNTRLRTCEHPGALVYAVELAWTHRSALSCLHPQLGEEPNQTTANAVESPDVNQCLPKFRGRGLHHKRAALHATPHRVLPALASGVLMQSAPSQWSLFGVGEALPNVGRCEKRNEACTYSHACVSVRAHCRDATWWIDRAVLPGERGHKGG